MADRLFQRKIYDRMLKWKQESNGDSALLIQGARRVGKSTAALNFAQNEYKSYILIDFSAVSKEVNDLFQDMSDMNYFFLRLQFLMHADLFERNSVIIFDEVQRQPLARQAIKHLVKDHRYDYIETGSLLSIRNNIKDIVIPSEETRITMNPMDYEEFRWALGDHATSSLIRKAIEIGKPLGNDVNRRMMRDFRLYMLIGGMPQAVNAYLDTNNLGRVDSVKREILDIYEEDFRKIDDTGKTSMFFDAIPAQLSKNRARYRITDVSKNSRRERDDVHIADMLDSLTVNAAYHSDDPCAGMPLNKDPDRYKLFLADTGLFITLAFKDKDFTENIIYEKMLGDRLSANLGYVYENEVAQMLRASGNQLFYYTMKSENSNHFYKIDFLISKRDKICPIEVKSSGYQSHASLDAFSRKYSSRILRSYLVTGKDLNHDGSTVMIPFYMVPFLL